jgi:hypothetical protein
VAEQFTLQETPMTQDEILEMAKSINEDWWLDDIDLKAFAKLVAEREREKFCAVLRQLHDSYSLASDSNAIRARGQA